MGLKKHISLKMEKKRIKQKESVGGSACMYVMCNIVWLVEGYFFFFMSCFPPFPCNLAGPVVSISSGGNSYILLVLVLSLQLAAHRSCLLFFYTEKKYIYIDMI